jgi:hypothetical protein
MVTYLTLDLIGLNRSYQVPPDGVLASKTGKREAMDILTGLRSNSQG